MASCRAPRKHPGTPISTPTTGKRATQYSYALGKLTALLFASDNLGTVLPYYETSMDAVSWWKETNLKWLTAALRWPDHNQPMSANFLKTRNKRHNRGGIGLEQYPHTTNASDVKTTPTKPWHLAIFYNFVSRYWNMPGTTSKRFPGSGRAFASSKPPSGSGARPRSHLGTTTTS